MNQQTLDFAPPPPYTGPTCAYPRNRQPLMWEHHAWWYDTTYTDATGTMPHRREMTWPAIIEEWL